MEQTSVILFMAVVIVASFLIVYSTFGIPSNVMTLERAIALGLAGISLALLFIGVRLDSLGGSMSSRQPQSDRH